MQSTFRLNKFCIIYGFEQVGTEPTERNWKRKIQFLFSLVSARLFGGKVNCFSLHNELILLQINANLSHGDDCF